MELHLAWIRNEGDGYDLIAAECPDGGAYTSDEDIEWEEAGYGSRARWLTVTVRKELVEGLFADDDGSE